mgnify:CR=1 FL=1
MLESVFFITLGISCVLLIMLIYHFKQRLNKLEQNGNTMFEIINNLVQEITTVNNNFRALSNVPQNLMQPNITHSKINVSLSDDEDNNLILEETYIDNEVNSNESCSDADNETDSDNDDDDESGSDNDDDDESGSDNDDEESDADTESDSDDENKSGTDNDTSDIGNLLEEADVKVVNIDLNNKLDSIDTPNNEVDTDDGNLEQVELNTDEIENILVNKLDETNDLDENDNSTPTSVNTGAVYKKMNVYSLKALVIEKGLSSDPSGLLKKELISLLKSNE